MCVLTVSFGPEICFIQIVFALSVFVLTVYLCVCSLYISVYAHCMLYSVVAHLVVGFWKDFVSGVG